MLSPEYLSALPDNIVKIYTDLEQKILIEMAKRIKKVAEAKNSNISEELKEHNKFVLLKLAGMKKELEQEVHDLYMQAMKQNIKNDKKYTKSPLFIWTTILGVIWLNRILKRGKFELLSEFSKLNRDISYFSSNKLFNGLRTAKFNVSSGMPPQTAISKTINTLADQGLTTKRDDGKQEKIESTIRRVVVTSINKSAANATLEVAKRMDFPCVETSAHAGARNKGTGPMNHESWQGRVFSLSKQ